MDAGTWAYCPDRGAVCAALVADAERLDRDAARIAQLGEELEVTKRDLARARAEARDLERENASLRRRLAIGGR